MGRQKKNTRPVRPHLRLLLGVMFFFWGGTKRTKRFMPYLTLFFGGRTRARKWGTVYREKEKRIVVVVMTMDTEHCKYKTNVRILV
jgi:hypothetical protein